MLTIQALKEDYSGADGVKRSFTSARIQTKGKFAQAYGNSRHVSRFHTARIWPAFWMMGDAAAEWPANGEIDIMENIGASLRWCTARPRPGYSGSTESARHFRWPRQRSATISRVCVEWEPKHPVVRRREAVHASLRRVYRGREVVTTILSIFC